MKHIKRALLVVMLVAVGTILMFTCTEELEHTYAEKKRYAFIIKAICSLSLNLLIHTNEYSTNMVYFNLKASMFLVETSETVLSY